jgi:hypothetical protein
MSAESEGDVAAELGTNCNLGKTMVSVCPAWRCPHHPPFLKLESASTPSWRCPHQVGMKLIPKPIVDAQILAHCIGIDPSCLFCQLLARGIISDSMLAGINWRSHQHLTIKVSDVAAVNLS